MIYRGFFVSLLKFYDMAKAKVNFYWSGKLIEAGKEAPEDAPKSLLVDEPKEDKPKRKNGRPKNLEDK